MFMATVTLISDNQMLLPLHYTGKLCHRGKCHSGNCHCFPRWHNFPVYVINLINKFMCQTFYYMQALFGISQHFHNNIIICFTGQLVLSEKVGKKHVDRNVRVRSPKDRIRSVIRHDHSKRLIYFMNNLSHTYYTLTVIVLNDDIKSFISKLNKVTVTHRNFVI